VSTTGRDLRRRGWVLLTLGVLTTVALFGAYRGVHDDAVPLASSTASGVLGVDTAKYALIQAQRNATQDAASDAAGTGDFHTQVSVADQSLAGAAADDITGPSGRQTLQTVAGLIAVYEGWVEQAGRVRAASVEHQGYMHDAEIMLGDTIVSSQSVFGRLDALQTQQLKVVDRQTGFGWALRLAWGLAAVLCLALAAALVETNGFLRARFRSRWNRWLAAAFGLLVAGVAVLVAFTWRTHRGLFHARAQLHQRHTGTGIGRAGTAIAHQMAGTGLRAGAAYWTIGGGLLLMIMVAASLIPRINEYRFRASR
jgi:hypothetical protein